MSKVPHVRVVDHDQIAELAAQATAEPRKRAHLLLHDGPADPVQRLMIVLQPNSYVRPHHHSRQWEMLVLQQGRGSLLIFDSSARLADLIELSPTAPVVQIPVGLWHGFVALERNTAEHGIFVDRSGNVWLAGNDKEDHQILKFSSEGKFLQQIGKPGAPGGSNSTSQLGSPAHMVIDETAQELYVADGYQNRRVIVFDSRSGAYKRHWGAYGNKPAADDKLPAYDPTVPLSKSFGNPVHCVRLSNDGLVYVCDRVNDRIQVFRKDGTFVKEFRVEPKTLANGSVWDLVLSVDPQQQFIFIADGANGQIHTLAREDGKLLTQWGRQGRQPGQFKWVHNIAIDSKGTLYTAEVGFGRRVQKFRPVQ